MEDAIAGAGNRGGQDQHRIAARYAQNHARQSQRPNPDEQDPLGASAIHGESSQRLPNAADDEEGRRQQPDLRISEGEIVHEPRKQRGEHQVVEMRGAVGETDEPDDFGMASCVGVHPD